MGQRNAPVVSGYRNDEWKANSWTGTEPAPPRARARGIVCMRLTVLLLLRLGRVRRDGSNQAAATRCHYWKI